MAAGGKVGQAVKMQQQQQQWKVKTKTVAK
jgi:hypothetical protein